MTPDVVDFALFIAAAMALAVAIVSLINSLF